MNLNMVNDLKYCTQCNTLVHNPPFSSQKNQFIFKRQRDEANEREREREKETYNIYSCSNRSRANHVIWWNILCATYHWMSFCYCIIIILASAYCHVCMCVSANNHQNHLQTLMQCENDSVSFHTLLCLAIMSEGQTHLHTQRERISHNHHTHMTTHVHTIVVEMEEIEWRFVKYVIYVFQLNI